MVDQVIGQVVSILRPGRRLDVVVVAYQFGVVVVGRPSKEAVEPVEAPA